VPGRAAEKNACSWVTQRFILHTQGGSYVGSKANLFAIKNVDVLKFNDPMSTCDQLTNKYSICFLIQIQKHWSVCFTKGENDLFSLSLKFNFH
jgi:hypothetical protein